MLMIARQKVADFDTWKQVFDSHAEAQRESGMELKDVLRNVDDPSDVFAIFEVTDAEKARGFVTSTDVPRAKEDSGVVGDTEIVFMA